MKITETITRECCQDKDLKVYQGRFKRSYPAERRTLKFCIYCGQIHELLPDTEPDPAGGPRQSYYQKIDI